jgi:uncharacterized protein (TIGR02246 family)
LRGPASAFAQAGVPGSRLETGRDHRATVRAEAYRSVARFFAEWREAWNSGDARALARLYTDDATLRLPGQVLVRGKEPVENAIRAATTSTTALAMSDVDFDSNGEWAVLVARYTVTRDGKLVEGVMTAVMFGRGSSWRLRAHTFDAPEKAANNQGAASLFTPLVVRDGRVGCPAAQASGPAPLRQRGAGTVSAPRLPAAASC